MRGRKPDYLFITAPDQQLLEDMARSRTLSWFQVQRARILLAIAAGERVQTVASRMSCDPSTVWRVCRRYQQQGLDSVRQEAHRTGRPARISPPGTRPDCGVGLFGTGRERAAYHPLEQSGLSPPGGTQWRGAGHECAHGAAHSA